MPREPSPRGGLRSCSRRAPDEVKHGAGAAHRDAVPQPGRGERRASASRCSRTACCSIARSSTTLPRPRGAADRARDARDPRAEWKRRGGGRGLAPLEEPRQTAPRRLRSPCGRSGASCSRATSCCRRRGTRWSSKTARWSSPGGLDPPGGAGEPERASLSGVTEHVGELEPGRRARAFGCRAWHAATGIGHGQIAIFGGEQTAPTGGDLGVLDGVGRSTSRRGSSSGPSQQMPAWSGRTARAGRQARQHRLPSAGRPVLATNAVPSAQIDRLIHRRLFHRAAGVPLGVEAAMAGSGETSSRGAPTRGQPTAKATVPAAYRRRRCRWRTERAARRGRPGRAFDVGGRGPGTALPARPSG